ncbi:MAG: Fur family transcriptional regulator [Thermodesulfobacteriota bacterium]
MDKIISRYRGKGFKLTPQRIAILQFLEGNTGHPTAEEIYSEIKKTNPTVSFATVYNTLQALKDRGELLEITIDPQRKHFDPNPEPHHHIICTECKKIGDIFVDYSMALSLPEEVLEEFQATGNHIDFYGICRDCRQKKSN